MRCRPATDGTTCEISQTILMQGQSNPLAMVAVGRFKKSDPMRFVVQLPANVTLAFGVKTQLANTESVADLAFSRCTPAGCFADVELTDAKIAVLKAQSEAGRVLFKDAAGRDLSFPFSLNGFDAAVDALSQS